MMTEEQERSVHPGTCNQENEKNKAVDDENLEEDQTYWQASLEEYSDYAVYGSGTFSFIASAAKVFQKK